MESSATLKERVQSLRLPDRAASVQPFPILPWACCFLFALLAGGFGYLAFSAPSRPTAVAVADAKSATSNSAGATHAPKPAPGGVILESKGYVVPVHQIQVSPKVSGTIMEVFFEEGQQVKVGHVLAKLETVEYQYDYDKLVGQTQSALHRYEELVRFRDLETKQAKADLDDANAQLDAAERDYNRNRELRPSRAVAERDVEQSDRDYRSMKARVVRSKLAYEMWIKGPRDEKIAAAKGEYQQNVADRDKAKFRLDNCTVLAPASGIILTKKAEQGNQVNPAAFSNGLAASLCDMADLCDMEVDLAIAERDIGRVFKGQKAKVVSEAFPDRPYEGEVSRIMPQADRAKGAVPVRVKLVIPRAEEGQYLRPDMGAIVTFYAKTDVPSAKK
ncbi:MAG TPA: efflux RND transporter periplasmic adaptor subunit [Gemmataceae bacterium]|jgi:multidrug resistance efflux pump|nr:efflux RND transporter periplasmic adaptor subunit [Gemmataceae bacterium]